MFAILLILNAGCVDYVFRGKRVDAPGGVDTAALEDTGPGLATEPIYVNSGTELFSWDPETNELVELGTFVTDGDVGIDRMTDIAIDLDGRMYGVASSFLFRVDPETATSWQLATLNEEMMGLTCLSDGRLVGTGEGVYVIDTQDGGQQTIVEPGRYETSGDIVGLPDGMLYWTVTGGDLLVVIDPEDGDTVVRADVGVEDIFGLGYANGNLYGFTQAGQAVVIDPYFGSLDDTMTLSGRWFGATTNPVLW